MPTAQDGDCAIYHGHGLLSAFQFPPIAGSSSWLQRINSSGVRADPAALQRRRVEGPKAFAENVSRNGTELGESAMKRFIDFEQIAA